VLDGDGRATDLSPFGDADGLRHVRRRSDGQGRLLEETDRFGQRSVRRFDSAGTALPFKGVARPHSTQICARRPQPVKSRFPAA